MKRSFLTSQFETPEQSSGFLLWQTYNKWHRLQSEALAALGLTHVQFVLLASTCWLALIQQEITQIMIATQASTDPMMTSQVLRTLEKNGYVIRKVNRSDQRERLISPTDKGKQLLKKALVAVETIDANFFEKLGDKQPAFLKELQQLLT
ncbi:MarR family transcriptional regulator [soil metagenome]